MKKLVLKAREERRLLRGHRWVYRNELLRLAAVEDGEPVDVYTNRERFVGRGFYQAQGGIAVRLLMRRQDPVGPAFLADRIRAASVFRDRMFPGQSVYRWVHGESDGLPGLVADRYGAVVSVHTSCAFYEKYIEALVDCFLSHDGVDGVYAQMADDIHRFGVIPEKIEIMVDGVKLSVELERGQKTGLFLDQRHNALAMRSFVGGARVLDGYCYAGLWSCHAALAGAREVLGVDTSASAIAQARENASLNGVEGTCTFECVDVSEVLDRDDRFDVVILDPPAFAKSREHLTRALGHYQALNRRAMDVIKPGGYLVTSSCSHFVEPSAFLETLKRAGRGAHRNLWVLDVRGAAPDHPVLLAMPETAYLKCVTLRVL